MAIGLTLALPAVAQAAPGAGDLMRDAERATFEKSPDAAPPIETPAIRPPHNLPGVTVTASVFRFEGNQLMSSEQLAGALEDMLHRPLTFDDLQEAVSRVTQRYQRAGYIAFAYLPPQKIVEGVVTIHVIEAVFGGARVAGGIARVSHAFVESIVDTAHAPGQPVRLDKLERGVLLANDLAGVGVTAALVPGDTEGKTDLQVMIVDEAPVTGNIMVDNAGARATGEERVIGQLHWNSPAGRGDVLSATLLGSQLAHYGRLHYGMPIGSDGWRVGAYYSNLPYELGEEFSSLAAEGDGDTAGADVTYALLRGRHSNLFVSATAEGRHYQNRSLGTVDSDYRVNRLALGVQGNHDDGFGPGGSTEWDVDLVAGRVDLDGSPSKTLDDLTAATHGDYQLVAMNASRLQRLSANAAIYLRAVAQFASTNLDSSEHFALGGPTGVRAYPVSEGSGDEGYVVSLELRHRASATATLATFYDYGSIRQNDDNNFPGAPGFNRYSLQGVGLSLLWSPRSNINANFTWAQRLGDNPNRLSSGADRDGSLRRDRIWLNLQYAF
ncbi:MAG: polypeptide-transport-associated domain protein ShlB-type [Gammaproteobacteria bacterium]|nr:MAG: polypeptide-transport-associated domain protein ShlB-type [Gammaproteobacteria bacterium]TND06394.1 MAG: polypeptide-transport-associated domain protein, ShlB-type [Gammaproteobacteria bacterium]